MGGWMKRILAITTLAWAGTWACTSTPSAVRDASVEPSPSDSAIAPADTVVALAVDFTVEGCPNFDPQTYQCTGRAPLTVRFVPITTTTITSYQWAFGDAFDSEMAPSHTYTTPGSYLVRLTATGPNYESVVKVHTDFVLVEPNTMGAPCDTSLQCEPGLFCLCPDSTSCPHGPGHGICSSNCFSGRCNGTDVCAGLRTAASPSGSYEGWQAQICLQACESSSDCSAGLSCRTLPPGPSTSGWVRGCFSAVPGDIGDSCVDESGALRNDLCATGMCVDLGSKGLCSADCSVTDCPLGSDCAGLGDGRRLCLRPCIPGLSCSDDPLITCVVPAPGAFGYQLVNPTSTSASSHCAPRLCLTNQDCPTAGTCPTGSGVRYCVRR
jgi:PKD repeat protein